MDTSSTKNYHRLELGGNYVKRLYARSRSVAPTLPVRTSREVFVEMCYTLIS